MLIIMLIKTFLTRSCFSSLRRANGENEMILPILKEIILKISKEETSKSQTKGKIFELMKCWLIILLFTLLYLFPVLNCLI